MCTLLFNVVSVWLSWCRFCFLAEPRNARVLSGDVFLRSSQSSLSSSDSDDVSSDPASRTPALSVLDDAHVEELENSEAEVAKQTQSHTNTTNQASEDGPARLQRGEDSKQNKTAPKTKKRAPPPLPNVPPPPMEPPPPLEKPRPPQRYKKRALQAKDTKSPGHPNKTLVSRRQTPLYPASETTPNEKSAKVGSRRVVEVEQPVRRRHTTTSESSEGSYTLQAADDSSKSDSDDENRGKKWSKAKAVYRDADDDSIDDERVRNMETAKAANDKMNESKRVTEEKKHPVTSENSAEAKCQVSEHVETVTLQPVKIRKDATSSSSSSDTEDETKTSIEEVKAEAARNARKFLDDAFQAVFKSSSSSECDRGSFAGSDAEIQESKQFSDTCEGKIRPKNYAPKKPNLKQESETVKAMAPPKGKETKPAKREKPEVERNIWAKLELPPPAPEGPARARERAGSRSLSSSSDDERGDEKLAEMAPVRSQKSKPTTKPKIKPKPFKTSPKALKDSRSSSSSSESERRRKIEPSEKPKTVKPKPKPKPRASQLRKAGSSEARNENNNANTSFARTRHGRLRFSSTSSDSFDDDIGTRFPEKNTELHLAMGTEHRKLSSVQEARKKFQKQKGLSLDEDSSCVDAKDWWSKSRSQERWKEKSESTTGDGN